MHEPRIEPYRPTVTQPGQSYVDDAVHATPLVRVNEVRKALGLQIFNRFLIGFERKYLRWGMSK